MNILILQGSPRANGNTAWMAEEYRKAAEAAGHKVMLVDVAHKKIAGCLACEYGHGKGNGACVRRRNRRVSRHPQLLGRRGHGHRHGQNRRAEDGSDAYPHP